MGLVFDANNFVLCDVKNGTNQESFLRTVPGSARWDALKRPKIASLARVWQKYSRWSVPKNSGTRSSCTRNVKNIFCCCFTHKQAQTHKQNLKKINKTWFGQTQHHGGRRSRTKKHGDTLAAQRSHLATTTLPAETSETKRSSF